MPRSAEEGRRIELAKSYSSPAGTEPLVVRSTPNRTVSRCQSIRDQVTHGTESFFGLTDDAEEQKKWTMRRLRYCSRRYGGLKEPKALSDGETTDGARRDVSLGRSISLDTNRSATVKRSLTQRDSVAKMAWNGLSTLVKEGCTLPRLRPRITTVDAQRSQRRSFPPDAFVVHKEVETAEQAEAQSSAFEGPSSSALLPSTESQPSDATVVLDQELKSAVKKLKD